MKNFKNIPLEDIKVSGSNPRKYFDEVKLKELVESIKEKGVIEPVIVRPSGETYELVCGERRLKASEAASKKSIPAIVRDLDDTQALEFQIIENLQRQDLNAIDEGQGFKVVLKKCGYTREDLATKVGKSAAYINTRIKLLDLQGDIQKAIAEDRITPGHGMVILRLKDPKDRNNLFKQILNEKLSVRQSENELSDYGMLLNKVPFNTKGCAECKNNGKEQKDLFDEDTNLKGRCLDQGCYRSKMKEFVGEQRKKLKGKGIKLISLGQLSKDAGKSSYEFVDISKGEWERSSLGKKYTKRCETCANHFYVTDKAEHGNMKGITQIKEVCTNRICANKGDRYPEDKNSGPMSEKEKKKRREEVGAKRLDEAKRRFWQKTLPGRKSQEVINAIALYHAINVLPWGSAAEVLNDVDYQHGIDTVEIFNLAPETVIKALSRAIAMYVPMLDLESLEVFSKASGVEISEEFIIDEEYLKGKSKGQLTDLAKEVGLDKYLKSKEYLQYKNLTTLKKTELLELFLEKGFDLNGVVPEEIKK